MYEKFVNAIVLFEEARPQNISLIIMKAKNIVYKYILIRDRVH